MKRGSNSQVKKFLTDHVISYVASHIAQLLVLCALGGSVTTGVAQTSLVPSHATVGQEQLLAAGVIVGDATALEISKWPRVFLPVTLWGQAATVMVDLGLSGTALSVESAQPVAPADHPEPFLTIGTHAEPPGPVEVHPPANPRDVPVLPAGLPPYVGVLGMPVLLHYDIEFDGPARTVRVYLPAGNSDTVPYPPSFWVPPGFTPADCVPLQFIDDGTPTGLPQIPIMANGLAMTGIFDSGSPFTIMNQVAATALGLTEHSPNVQPVKFKGQYAGGGRDDRRDRYRVTGVALAFGTQPLPAIPILQLPTIPMAHVSDQPILDLGLDALVNRRLFFSFSSNHVCLSTPVTSSRRPT